MSRDDHSYFLSRGFSANARTALQHYLYKDQLDYLIHPKIPTNKEGLRVAEIGVGTSIWMIELSRELSSTAQLDGLDVEFAQCPPKEWLAPNISWITHDIFSEPPAKLIEVYDVIHVQLFITILRDGNPVPMLKNLMKMLRGYIQWGEWDFTTWEILRTKTAPSEQNDELDQIRSYISTMGGTKANSGFLTIRYYPRAWITNLHETFTEHGLRHVFVDRRRFDEQIVTLLLDTWIMAAQELSSNVLDKLGGGKGDTMRGFIEQVRENRGNTAFNLDRVITIGQKPV
ncbi:hypothetical protein N0V90_006986 [Kalmusia sp. IMI 367209]|nr:hypothetical protein N0V90_006986 [Kalmusia sp. IMI 367209]